MRSSRKIKSELSDMEITNSSVKESVSEHESNSDTTITNDVTKMLDTIDKKSEISDELRALLDLKPILDNLHILLVKDENNIINGRLGIVSYQEELTNASAKLAKTINDVVNYVDSINKHLDDMLNSAPDKLKVQVTASDNDMKAIQKMCDDKVKKIKALHEEQLNKISEDYERWTHLAYEQANKARSDVHERLKHEDGLYLTGFWYWFCGFFFWIGVIIVVVFLTVEILKSFE